MLKSFRSWFERDRNLFYSVSIILFRMFAKRAKDFFSKSERMEQ